MTRSSKLSLLTNTLYPTSKIGTYPQIYVSVADKNMIKMACYKRDADGWSFTLDKRTARLLARRLNQCLDDLAEVIRND